MNISKIAREIADEVMNDYPTPEFIDRGLWEAAFNVGYSGGTTKEKELMLLFALQIIRNPKIYTNTK